jgi:hypothetical protein
MYNDFDVLLTVCKSAAKNAPRKSRAVLEVAKPIVAFARKLFRAYRQKEASQPSDLLTDDFFSLVEE